MSGTGRGFQSCKQPEFLKSKLVIAYRGPSTRRVIRRRTISSLRMTGLQGAAARAWALAPTLWIGENFGGESFQPGAGLPCVGGQAGFSAGLFEKGDAVPSVLDWHLRQQQAAVGTKADQQAVASDFNLIRLQWVGLEKGC